MNDSNVYCRSSIEESDMHQDVDHSDGGLHNLLPWAFPPRPLSSPDEPLMCSGVRSVA